MNKQLMEQEKDKIINQISIYQQVGLNKLILFIESKLELVAKLSLRITQRTEINQNVLYNRIKTAIVSERFQNNSGGLD